MSLTLTAVSELEVMEPLNINSVFRDEMPKQIWRTLGLKGKPFLTLFSENLVDWAQKLNG